MVESSLPTDPNANGARGEIDRLIAEHHRALYRYAYRLAGREADAEDLTQQTFVTAQQKIHQLRDPAKVRSWLFTVLRNCFLKSHRKQRPLSAGDLELEIDAIAEPIPEAPQIDRQDLQAAVDLLPDEFKLVVVMFYFEERSYKEIAAELKIPPGTVMSRLARAKGRLRHRLLDGQVVHAPHSKDKTPENTTSTTKFAPHVLKGPKVTDH